MFATTTTKKRDINPQQAGNALIPSSSAPIRMPSIHQLPPRQKNQLNIGPTAVNQRKRKSLSKSPSNGKKKPLSKGGARRKVRPTFQRKCGLSSLNKDSTTTTSNKNNNGKKQAAEVTIVPSITWKEELDELKTYQKNWEKINTEYNEMMKQKKHYKDSLLDCERRANTCQKEYNEMMEESKSLGQRINSAEREVDSMKQDVERLKGELITMEIQVVLADENLEAIQLKQDSLDTEIAQLNDIKSEAEKDEAKIVELAEKNEETIEKILTKRKRSKKELDKRKTKRIRLTLEEMEDQVESTTFEKEEKIKKLEETLRKSKEEASSKGLCFICRDKSYNAVLSCRHTCCNGCVNLMTKNGQIKCPFCKAISKSEDVIIFVLPE